VLPPVAARPHPRARRAAAVERHTIIPAKGTIIPAGGTSVGVRVVVAPPTPAAGTLRRLQAAAPRSAERHPARRTVRTTRRIAHVPATPRQAPPAQPAPTASIAAVQAPPTDGKAARKAQKAQEKAQRQQQKPARRGGNAVTPPAAQRKPGGPRRGRR
jgi:hypothetical protein